MLVDYDRKGLIVGSQRILLFSASIHYPRCQPSDWQQLIEFAKEAGINCVETYVFWNQHERERGVYDFSGRLDLFGFLQTISQAGLYALLRIGPYICAETNFGGFPHWLRDIEGIQFRTQNEPFQRESSRWVRYLVEQLNLHRCFFTQGGPIIMVQLENEYKLIGQNYGEAGRNYLKWCSELAKDLHLPVPLFMCKGSIENVLETINDFYGHHEIDNHHREYPNQPAIWTECWTGWYDVWGSGHHIRPCKDLYYAVLRFFAQGGKGINYYMFYGGTNYDQLAMYLQTTSYDYDAPIDEYGRRREKYFGLQYIHRQLQRYFSELALSLEAPSFAYAYEQQMSLPEEPQQQQQYYVWIYIWEMAHSNCIFLCNDHPTSTKQVHWRDQVYSLAPLSVQMIVNDDHWILRSDRLQDNYSVIAPPPCRSLSNIQWKWEYCPVDIPTSSNRISSSLTISSEEQQSVPEMLRHTGIATDYAWYIAYYQIDSQFLEDSSNSSLEWIGGQLDVEAADYVQVYVNGIYKTSSPLPLLEERFPNDWNQHDQHTNIVGRGNSSRRVGFHQHMEFTHSEEIIQDSTFCIAFLVSSLGMIKGDWQLEPGWNMKDERKGLLGIPKVTWKIRGRDGTCLLQLVSRSIVLEPLWMQWPLSCSWLSTLDIIPREGPCWVRAMISFKEESCTSSHHWLLDLKGFYKGRIWWNRQDLGRYWLIPCQNCLQCSFPVKEEIQKETTQRFYFIPKSMITCVNELILFEERAITTLEDIDLLEIPCDHTKPIELNPLDA